jgi:hypothetical protein
MAAPEGGHPSISSQLTAVDPDESTDEAVGDWHYWVAQGYCL